MTTPSLFVVLLLSFQINEGYKNYRVVMLRLRLSIGVHYLYSSARDYHATKKCGLLDLVFL